MAIGKAEKAAYNDEIKDIKREVETTGKLITESMVKKKKAPRLEGYYNLEATTYHIYNMRLFFKMNDLSLDMLGIKNETFLNNARKEFYKILQMLEETVGDDIDRSLRENDEFIQKIDQFDAGQILALVERIHDMFMILKQKVGEGSKWKWSFVELQGRIAVITKNITNFSDVAKYRDPRSEFYRERLNLMQLCKDSLAESAKLYRNKYELSGRARDDMKRSIELLAALRKIHVLFGEDGEATKLKNTIDAARQTLEAEDQAKENKKKKK